MSQKLSWPCNCSNCYWALLKRMINDKKKKYLFLRFYITICLSLTLKKKTKVSILIFLLFLLVLNSITLPPKFTPLSNFSLHSLRFHANVFLTQYKSYLMLVLEREFSHQTCRANQLTGFYMMATLAFNELIFLLGWTSEAYLGTCQTSIIIV